MHLKKLLKLLEQGPKAFSMVRRSFILFGQLSSRIIKVGDVKRNYGLLKGLFRGSLGEVMKTTLLFFVSRVKLQVKWGGCAILSSLPMEQVGDGSLTLRDQSMNIVHDQLYQIGPTSKAGIMESIQIQKDTPSMPKLNYYTGRYRGQAK